MTENYYAKNLNASNLYRVYETGIDRVRRYLDAEIDFVRRGLRGDERVLELGAGYGRIMKALAPFAASVTGIDISEDSVAFGREYLADATGALTTRHPDALASALQKLADYGRPMQRQNSTMAHMWISDPTKPGVMDRMFSTHPPIPERIKRLGEIGSGF